MGNRILSTSEFVKIVWFLHLSFLKKQKDIWRKQKKLIMKRAPDILPDAFKASLAE